MEPRENPMLFGHQAAERTFEEAIAAGRVHHAWLLTGPGGVGKATLAYRLARRLLAAEGANDPTSPVFRRVATGSHADLLSIEREVNEKTRKVRTTIAVEQTRAISGFMHLTPAEGGWRVVVLDGADEMNANAANALLKILEEPSRRGILFLTADAPGRLLPTIRSRCRRLPLGPLGAEAMAGALGYLLPEMAEGERDRLGVIAEGSPGQALLLAGEGGLAVSVLVDEVLAEAPRLAVGRMHDVAERVTRTETGFSTFMTLLQAGLGKAVRGAAARSTGWAGDRPGDGDHGRLKGRAGDEENGRLKGRPGDEENGRLKGRPGDEENGRLKGRPTDEENGRLKGRPLAEWGEVWHALGRLQVETERFNLDKRTAVIAGLELLSGS